MVVYGAGIRAETIGNGRTAYSAAMRPDAAAAIARRAAGPRSLTTICRPSEASIAMHSISGITYMLRSRTPETGGTAWRTARGSGIDRSAPAACNDGPSASRKKSAAQNVQGRAALGAVLTHATVANASAVYPRYAVCSGKFPVNVARVARTSGPASQWSYAGRKNASRSTLHRRISSSDDWSGACGGSGVWGG